MNKKKIIIFAFLMFILNLNTISAASLNVRANNRLVTVGNSVNITVSVSYNTQKLDDHGVSVAWEYCLNYDSSVFQLTNHGSPCVKGGTNAKGTESVTFTFKAKKKGSSNFGLRDASILDYAAREILTSKGSVNVSTRTQAEIEASYSKNADLRGLSVKGYDLTPEFDKNTLKYTLEVENEVDKITIDGTRSDNRSHVSGLGEKELTEGLNKFDIVVTAEKGNKKTYTIEVNRKELNPIIVEVAGKKYHIVRKKENLDTPSYYTYEEIEIDGEKIPAFKSDITGFVLVGLKDEEGNIELYRYKNNNYELYKQLPTDKSIIIPLNNDTKIEEYPIKKEIEINKYKVECYVNEEEKDFALVYGMNASNGIKSWYKYDKKENTFQRYQIVTNNKKDSSKKTLYIVIIF